MANPESILTAPLEQQLYQLVIARLDGSDVGSQAYREACSELVRRGICGFIVFGGEKNEIAEFLRNLQSLSDIPLFIASDIERGVGQQIEGTTVFPCQMAMAAAIDRSDERDTLLLENALAAIAEESHDIGINMPLIPVLDVNRDPDNPIIATRAFSDDPEVVAWFGMEYIRHLEDAGLSTCAKHFPGHGDTHTDSHLSLPIIEKSFEEWFRQDAQPFVAAVRHGVSCVMMGHLKLPVIEPLPATLSPKMHALLRKTIGFNGIVMTDALTMSALEDSPETALQALLAGADILLHPADPHRTVGVLREAIAKGTLREERIHDALTRIVRRKVVLPHPSERRVDYQAHAALSSDIARKSVTLVKYTPGIVPLHTRGRIRIVLSGDRTVSPLGNLKKLSPDIQWLSDTNAIQNADGEPTIIALLTSIAAWKGSPMLAHGERRRIQTIIENSRSSLILSFGNPYVLRHFPAADILVAAYDASEECQMTIVRWLRGEDTLKGRLPVRLPLV